MFSRGQQHGGVAIVPAGVHQTCLDTGVGQAGGFLNGQGVHVSPQAQLARTIAALELTHHTRATQAARDGIAPARQALGHQIAGAKLLKTDFWVLMDVAAQRREGVCAGLQG